WASSCGLRFCGDEDSGLLNAYQRGGRALSGDVGGWEVGTQFGERLGGDGLGEFCFILLKNNLLRSAAPPPPPAAESGGWCEGASGSRVRRGPAEVMWPIARKRRGKGNREKREGRPFAKAHPIPLRPRCRSTPAAARGLAGGRMAAARNMGSFRWGLRGGGGRNSVVLS